MIFRRPQNIEYVVLLLSLGFVVLLLITTARALDISTVQSENVRVGLVLTALCLLGETFLRRDLSRILFLAAHLVIGVAIIFALNGDHVVEELVIVSIFVLNCSLRLRPVRGVSFSALALALATLIGFRLRSPLYDRFVILLFGAFWTFITSLIMYYREELVAKSKVVDAQHRSLENLVAASHSFVEHLESVELESAERERQRITRELHDEIGYAMMNIAMMMNASPGLMRTQPDKLLDFCEKTREVATTTLRETRATLYRLRDMHEKVTQNPAIFFASLCSDFTAATGVETECHAGNLPRSLNELVFNILMRGIQVAFINALRHGNASLIRLSFWITEDDLTMSIWNDTKDGADDSAVLREGIGLAGMRERLATIDGVLKFGTIADGFEIQMSIPKEELLRATN